MECQQVQALNERGEKFPVQIPLVSGGRSCQDTRQLSQSLCSYVCIDGNSSKQSLQWWQNALSFQSSRRKQRQFLIMHRLHLIHEVKELEDE
jgi:hypothetical protein